MQSSSQSGSESSESEYDAYDVTVVDDHGSSWNADLLRHVLCDKEDVLLKLLKPSQTYGIHPLWPSEDPSVIAALVNEVKQQCAEDLKGIWNAGEYTSEDRPTWLYEYLWKIFRTVEKEAANFYHTRTVFRQLAPKDSQRHPVMLDDPAYPDGIVSKPDFLLADVPPPSSETNGFVADRYASKKLRWRQCAAFVNVRYQSGKFPVTHLELSGSDSEYELLRMGRRLLAESADHARTLLGCRPFMRYVYGLFVCGKNFGVALFDRCGIVISPKYSLSTGNDDGLEKLVRILLRLLWEMSPVELGQDPSVRLLPMTPPQTYYQDAFPRFVVTMGLNHDGRQWTTIGPPVWVSHSLLGRGTCVWRTIGPWGKTPAILKVAWRSKDHNPEFDIYKKIRDLLEKGEDAGHDYPAGIAYASEGGDVYHNGVPISISVLRGAETVQPADIDRVLHRVSLPTFGKPLWKYSSVEELVLALLEVIEGHRVLSEKGILHRDISIGNILIKVSASYKPATSSDLEDIIQADLPIHEAGGFLADFEFASFQHEHERTRSDLETGTSTFAKATERNPSRLAREGVTGTVMFMATELLVAIENEKTTSRTVEQDIESFMWVILYAVYKHALNELEPHTELRLQVMQEFCDIFDARSAKDLLTRRIHAFSGRFGIEDGREIRLIAIRHLCDYADPAGRGSHLVGFLVYAVWSPLRKRFREIKEEGLKASFPPDLKRFMHYYGDENDSGHAGRKTVLTHQVLIETLQVLLESERMARSV